MRSTTLLSRRRPRKQTLLLRLPKEVPKSIPCLEVPVNLQVPMKARPSKFCQHCKAKGRPHLTHNTKECRRYNGNGNPVSSFQGKPANAKKPAKKGGGQQMAYLTAAVESLVKKGLKKAMKNKKRKRNHAYDSSSDSDSE
jgi:hypothetical protein